MQIILKNCLLSSGHNEPFWVVGPENFPQNFSPCWHGTLYYTGLAKITIF